MSNTSEVVCPRCYKKDTTKNGFCGFCDCGKIKVEPWWDYFDIWDNFSYTETSIRYKYIADHCLSKQALKFNLRLFKLNRVFDKSLFLDIKKIIKSLGGELCNCCYKSSFYYKLPAAFVSVSIMELGCEFCLTSSDVKLYNDFGCVLKKFPKYKPVPAGKVYALVPDSSGKLESKSLGVGSINLIEDNYRPEVLQGYQKVVNDILSTNPSGRVSIFDGPPGSGKTYLIRALLSACPKTKFLLLPANMVSTMTGPELLGTLIKESPGTENSNKKDKTSLVLVLEDADSCLSIRAADNISAISSILNLSDGIIGNLLDFRIICTTNAEAKNIDEAILRPGRLSARVEVGFLDKDHAQRVYNRLGGKETVLNNKFYSLAEVYTMARGDNVFYVGESKQDKKIGF
jgi:hypothetical protein